jgi:hypothetical protein
MLNIIGILSWGLGLIPQSAWAQLEEDGNLVEVIRTSRVIYAKPLKVAWGTRHWTLKSKKRNQTKKMDAISKYHDFEIIHGQYFSILMFFLFFYIVCILTLESIYFFVFLC